MKKTIPFILIIALCFSFSAFTTVDQNTSTTEKESIEVENMAFAITLRYYNKDSKDHEFKVKTCGSTKKVKFDKSKTSSVTIQSGCSDAVIYDKCGEVKVKTGDKITIKDGCIKID